MSRIWRSCRESVAVTGLFVLLTAIMTWPQVRVVGTHAVDHQDVFFNMWRLRWFAHALSTSPLDLFNANIFYPERGVLAYSDAMLVQGLIAAPLLWAGVPSVLVHNLLLLGAIVASGVGAFFLARHLTGSAAGAIAAGIVFAFAPYRFDHYFHMELQWAIWTPWALWALQRSIETGSMRYGLLTGLFVALQIGSSVYYGVFLGILLAVVTLVQLLAANGRRLWYSARSLAVAAAIAAAFAAIYVLPYAAASERVGRRVEGEAATFSARPRDYRAATPTNLLYGERSTSPPERRLFPGILPALLALIGLLLVAPRAVMVAYVIALVVAFEMSLGFFGHVYPWLYEHINVFRGLRAPARAAIFCLLFLGVLAAYGLAALSASWTRQTRGAIAALACAGILFEYWVAPLQLTEYHNQPPPLYTLLARLPPGVVAQFPMPKPGSPPHHDPRYAYMSTFHWKPLLNGYSGFFPPSYLERLRKLEAFPDARSLEFLRSEGTKYIVVHADGYPAGERERIIEKLMKLGLVPAADFADGWSVATVFELH